MWKVFDDRTYETLFTSEHIGECISYIHSQVEMDGKQFNHLWIGKYESELTYI